MDLLRSLELAGVDLKRTGKVGEYIATCPQCQKKKLAIHVEKKVWQCWFCNISGGTFALSKLLGIKLQVESEANFSKLRNKYVDITPSESKPYIDPDNILPKEFTPLTTNGIIAKKAWDFVINRGVTPEMIKKWNLGYCTSGVYKGYIIIPVYDLDNQIRTFQGRRFTGYGDKNKNPYNIDKIVFNLRHAQGFPGIVVVEGPWDAMGTHTRLSERLNISSVGLLGHSCNAAQARQIAAFLKPEYTWVCLDPDVSELEREKVANVLMSEGLPNVTICHPKTDPDEILYNEFVIVLQEAIKPIRRKIVHV